MTRTKLDTPAFADQSVDSRNIADGTIQNQDISGSLTNDKLANSSFTINGSSLSLGASTSIITYLDWQAVTVADGSTTLTAEAGKGYFLDTNTGVIEVFLPTSPSRGDTIALVDYSGTFATNKCIINTGTQNIDSTVYPEYKVETNNSIVELVYVDANKGWQVLINQAAGTTPEGIVTSDGIYDPSFVEATGGTITTSGNDKIHTFTGDGCFVVTSLASNPANSKVEYLVIAGGGGGGGDAGGGGGAGGFRTNFPTPSGLSVSVQTYPITVGGGGAGVPKCSSCKGASGSNSVFSTITSAGGGGGGSNGSGPGANGGSGGGGRAPGSGGSGNTPPVSPPQGNDGGDTPTGGHGGSGGGGAGAAGTNGSPQPGGPGGNGTANSITGSSVTRAGGGGGGANGGSATKGSGGSGGGGDGGDGGPGNPPGGNGTANTGGGAGGGSCTASTSGGTGGKGIVIIRYKFQ